MTRRVAILGMGGHGRECLFIARSMIAAGADIQVVGFYDDGPSDDDLARVAALGYPHLGTFPDLLVQRDLEVCLGVGAPSVRWRLDQLLLEAGLAGAVLVHPDSTVGDDVALSEGCVIFPGARLTTNIQLGRHTHLHPNVTVGHDTMMGDYVSINPSASLSGGCTVGRGAFVGAGSLVLQGLTLGESCVVGGAACVVRDVAPGALVKGVPAR